MREQLDLMRQKENIFSKYDADAKYISKIKFEIEEKCREVQSREFEHFNRKFFQDEHWNQLVDFTRSLIDKNFQCNSLEDA